MKYTKESNGIKIMCSDEKLRKKIKEVEGLLHAEIEKIDLGRSEKNKCQMLEILKEISEIKENKEYVLSFPRAIVDSWDYSDKLGSELLSVANLHKQR